jgi:hypothetical protein
MVNGLEKSISFYRDVIGLEVRGTLVHTDPAITLVFLGFSGTLAAKVMILQPVQPRFYLGHQFQQISVRSRISFSASTIRNVSFSMR